MGYLTKAPVVSRDYSQLNSVVVSSLKAYWPKTVHGEWMSPECDEGLVSVIIPTYNRAQFITRALESILEQSYRPIEIIVVDDGSEDETVRVVTEWSQSQVSGDGLTVRLFKQQNRGPGAARNHGLVKSRGQFIQFLDSDDILHPRKVETHVNELRTMNTEFVWSPMVETPRDALLEGAFPPQPEWSSVWFQSDDSLPASACAGMYRREVCCRIGPWAEDLVCKEDWDYLYRLKCLKPRASHVPAPQYAAALHRSGRVHDRFHTPDGIASLLEVIRRGERYRQAAPKADISLRMQYLRVLRSILRLENSAFGDQLLDLVRTSPELKEDHLKFRIVLGTKSLLGGRLASKLFDWYSSARLAINNRL